MSLVGIYFGYREHPGPAGTQAAFWTLTFADRGVAAKLYDDRADGATSEVAVHGRLFELRQGRQFVPHGRLTGVPLVPEWPLGKPGPWRAVAVEVGPDAVKAFWRNADGTETLWSFEGSAPPSLLQRGISGSTFEPGNTVTISYCPLKDGRPGGGLGWARLANGTFVNPADGGCDGSVKAIEKWKGWLAAGYTSSTDALKPK